MTVFAIFAAWFIGYVLGRGIEAADWRATGTRIYMGTGRHKSGGRWYRVEEEST